MHSQGINRVIFSPDATSITAMVSAHGETVNLSKSIRIVPQVEVSRNNSNSQFQSYSMMIRKIFLLRIFHISNQNNCRSGYNNSLRRCKRRWVDLYWTQWEMQTWTQTSIRPRFVQGFSAYILLETMMYVLVSLSRCYASQKRFDSRRMWSRWAFQNSNFQFSTCKCSRLCNRSSYRDWERL